MTVQLFYFLSYSPSTFFPTLVPGPRPQLQVLEAGMSPKQEIVIIPLHHYVRIPNRLMGQVVPTPHLAKLGVRESSCVAWQ